MGAFIGRREPRAGRGRRNLTAFAAALALPLSGLAVTPAAAADTVAIPQAPVLSVIAKTETLPFTLDGGGDIEVAVLTDGQNIGDANWTVTDELALAPYNGQTIRVLARKAGITNPADYFDASYTVRDTYPPGEGLGTPENPSAGVPYASPRFVNGVRRYLDYQPGPNVWDSWKTWDGTNTPMMILGDQGQVTAQFAADIVDGEGDDFAVFENGFRVAGSDRDFLELGYVEVSSNGTDFVRFDSASLTPDEVGAFGGILASNIAGLGGKDLNNYGTSFGTGFDLALLRNRPEVRSGAVDLNAISEVRIVDIAGCGDERDSFGRVIWDPCGTAQSGGFDLAGIQVLHQATPVAWVDSLTATDLGPSTATIKAKVSTTGAAAQSVWAEISSNADGSGATRLGNASVPANQRDRAVSFTATGLKRGQTYYYRLVSADSADGSSNLTAADWRSFVAPDIALVTWKVVQNGSLATLDGKDRAVVTFNGGANPYGYAKDLTMRVEYSSNPDHSGSQFTAAVPLDRRQTYLTYQTFTLLLEPGWDYSARVVVTDADGKKVTGDWVDFTAGTENNHMQVQFQLFNTDIAVYQDTTRMCADIVTADPSVTGATVTMSDLFGASGRYEETVAFENSVASFCIGGDTTGWWWPGGEITAIGGDPAISYTNTFVAFGERSGDASISEVVVGDLSATAARVSAAVWPGSFGSQLVSVEYLPVPADADPATWTPGESGDALSTGPVLRTLVDYPAGTAQIPQIGLSALRPGTTYKARVVAVAATNAEAITTSDWVTFATDELPPALTDASVAEITQHSATVSGEVVPGAYRRSVAAEVQPVAGGDAVTTAATVVDEQQTVTVALQGLSSNTAYQARLVSTVEGVDETETTAWVEFTTDPAPASLEGSSVSALSSKSATVDVVLVPGDLAQQVRVEYTGGAKADASTSKAVAVPAGMQPVTVPVVLKGLSANTEFSYRVTLRASDGAEMTSDWSSFTTAKVADPSLSVSVSPASARVGDTATVTWKTTDATAVTATGSWSGSKALSGTEKVKITKAGTWTFAITATGEAGNTTEATAVVSATLPAKELTLTGQKPVTAAGKKLSVKATGLTASEPYTITISGIRTTTGKASLSGVVSRSVTVPKVLGAGSHTITVTGATTDRTGTATAKLVAATKKLTVKATSKVRRGKKVTVKVSGLGAYELATIKVGSTKVTKVASKKGTVSVKVTVPKKTRVGKTKITITGITAGRTGTKTIKVTT